MSPTLLYITGWCRSGSTLLGNVLAEVPDIVHVGELRFLWLNGVLKAGSNTRCGCGRELLDCPLWGNVLRATCPAGRALTDHAADVVSWQAGCRTRHTWDVLRRPPRNGWPDTLRAAYRTVMEITGARVLVDSSKYASDAALFVHRPGADLRPAYVHLVRDPRAVACSWLRPKSYVEWRSALDSTFHWAGFNLAAEAVGRHARRGPAAPAAYLRMRYEDLVARPRAAVAQILQQIGHAGPNPVSEDGTVEFGDNHTVTGNPDRFRRGRVAIEEDRRWHTALPRRHRVGTTLMALPLLRRYGYEVRF